MDDLSSFQIDFAAPAKMLFTLKRGLFVWTPLTLFGVVGYLLLAVRDERHRTFLVGLGLERDHAAAHPHRVGRLLDRRLLVLAAVPDRAFPRLRDRDRGVARADEDAGSRRSCSSASRGRGSSPFTISTATTSSPTRTAWIGSSSSTAPTRSPPATSGICGSQGLYRGTGRRISTGSISTPSAGGRTSSYKEDFASRRSSRRGSVGTSIGMQPTRSAYAGSAGTKAMR